MSEELKRTWTEYGQRMPELWFKPIIPCYHAWLVVHEHNENRKEDDKGKRERKGHRGHRN